MSRHSSHRPLTVFVVLAMMIGLAACAKRTVPVGAPPSPVAPRGTDRAAPLGPPPAPRLEVERRAEQVPPAIAAPTGPPKVALLVPLSGRAAEVGAGLRNAAEMALFEIAGPSFALAFYDTASTPMGAARAAERALAEGARMIIGPLFSASTQAVGPIAAPAGVPVLSFSNDRSVAGGGIWVFGLLPTQQVDRVVRYAVGRGFTRIGALVPANAYGSTAIQAARASAEAAGAAVSRAEVYRPEAQDLADLVKRFADYDIRRQELGEQRADLRARGGDVAKSALKRLETLDTTGPYPYDAVLVPAGGEELRNLAPLMAYYDIDPVEVKYLGTALWAEPGLGREPTLVGGWFAAPSPATRAAFEARYRDAFGAAPPGLASLAYDGVALAAVLARAPEGPAFDAASLTQESGFAGVDGLFRLLPDGGNERGLAILRLTQDGYEVEDPAPVSFELLLN
ncbi:MAG: penicillin-binding protein activator [Alphaproteobacteria bacterium]|nr:penicillin-binding protein activator [Alphaproteobacteria bacterium]